MFIAGFSDAPFAGTIDLLMTGTTKTPAVTPDMDIGALQNVILVRGQLQLYGSAPSVLMASLTAPAPAGSSTLLLDKDVEWLPGDELVLTSSYRTYTTSENVVIQQLVNKRTITTQAPLAFSYYGTPSTLNSATTDLNVRTQVLLLRRGIVLRSADPLGAQLVLYGPNSPNFSLKIQNVQFIGFGQSTSKRPGLHFY